RPLPPSKGSAVILTTTAWDNCLGSLFFMDPILTYLNFTLPRAVWGECRGVPEQPLVPNVAGQPTFA
ncbi:MAG: hypothetical protein ACM309_05840, partial [Bacillota bacterium]